MNQTCRYFEKIHALDNCDSLHYDSSSMAVRGIKSQIVAGVRYLFTNFGPLIIFATANHYLGEKKAITLSVIYSVIEIGLQRMRGEPLTPFFIFSAATTLIFGGIDIYLPHSFLFKYEASLSNIITGVFFVVGAYGEKPLIQQFAERSRKTMEMTPELTRYFFLFTFVWAGYFFLKAAVYAWLAFQPISIEKLMIIRTIIGSVSFYALLGISIFGGRHFFLFFKKLGLLSTSAETAPSGTQAVSDPSLPA